MDFYRAWSIDSDGRGNAFNVKGKGKSQARTRATADVLAWKLD